MESCTRLRLVSVHQDPPCTDVFMKGATTVKFLISGQSYTRGNIRSVLPGLRKNVIPSCCWTLNPKLLRTWLCHHLKYPSVSTTWHSERMCWRPVLSLLQRGHLASLLTHWGRFSGQGRVSYAALIKKLSCACGVCQISDQLMTCGVLQSGPCPLCALGRCLNKVAFLFHPCNFLHNQV